MRTNIKENIGRLLFIGAAIVCVLAVLAIFLFMCLEALPAFKKIGLFRFLLGKEWSPSRLDKYEGALSGSYGIFKMIAGTCAATIGALAIGGTLGYFTAVFLAFYCPQKLKKIFSSTINLLAGIPSVVYGFFGIVFLLPLLSNVAPNNGSGLLATSLILGIMIMPTVVSLSKTSLEAVPRAYYEGALALGANRSRTVFGTMTKAAKSGILASIILGIGRALGETMAVVMVAGNSVAYPKTFFNSFRTMTANIVMEMGYAGDVQRGALVATGVILLFFVLLVNVLFVFFSKKAVEGMVKKTRKPRNKKYVSWKWWAKIKAALSQRTEYLKYKLHASELGAIGAIICGVTVASVLLLVIGFIFVKGAPYLVQNPHLLIGKYEFGSDKVTILPPIVTTLMTVGLSLFIAVPIGVCTAIFMHEYARQNHFFIRFLRGAIDVLNGVPSIVYGLFGMITFVGLIKGTGTILAGSLTVSIMLLPTIVRSTEESLKSVQAGLREGSFALGAGKWRTVFKIVLPSALPGILSAVILSMGRVISESAPFLYTMGSVISAVPTGYLDSNATLAVALYRLSGEGWHVQEAYATAVVLIVLVFLLNLFAEWIAAMLDKKLKGDS